MNETSVVRIDSELLDKIRIYAEIENKSMSELVSELLKNGLSYYINQRSGGATMMLKNPRILSSFDESKQEQFMNILNDAANKMQTLDSGISFPIQGIIAFYNLRFHLDTMSETKMYQFNAKLDDGWEMDPLKK